MDTEIRFALLGPVRAWRGETELNVGHPQQRAVLAALLLSDGAQKTLDELVDGLWGDTPPATAPSTIRTYVYRLRQALGDGKAGLIRSTGGGYVLEAPAGSVDLTRFKRLASRASAARRAGDPASAYMLLGHAQALWTGTSLAGVPGPAAAAQRVLLEELRLAATEDRLVCGLDLGRYTQAAAELSYLVSAHPLRERLRELLMVALYRSGRQADALAVFDDTRRFLREELGVDPAPRLQEVHRRILQADPDLETETSPTGPGPGPRSGGHSATVPHPDPTADAEEPAGTAAEFRTARTRQPIPLVRPAQLPAGLAYFTGRQREIDELRARASGARDSSRGDSIVVIDGMAGIGKTSLALHWAHQVASGFPDGQLYADLRGFDPAGGTLDPAAVLGQFLQALGVTAHDIPPDLTARAALYRSLLAERRILVLLDNARDAVQVRPLLPGGPGCLTLVTGRNQLSGLVTTHHARAVGLQLPGVEEARELLALFLGPDRVAAERRAADEILEYCGRLPLAVAVVAARAARRPALPLSALAEELSAMHGGLDAFSSRDPAIDARTVFSWSYGALTPQAARLFRLLALHPGPDITAPAAAGLIALPLRQVRVLLGELVGSHMLTEHIPGRYASHDLLRAYAAELVQDTDDDQDAAIARLLDHYLHTAASASRSFSIILEPVPLPRLRPGVQPEEITGHKQGAAWLLAEQRVLVAAVALAESRGFDAHAWQLAWSLEDFLDQQALWHDLLAVERAALEASSRLPGSLARGHALRGLARAEAHLGLHDSARAHVDQALALFDGSADTAARAETLRQISWLMEQQAAYDDALAHAEQALALHNTTNDRKKQAIALSSVGWCNTLLGRHRQALDYCYEALTMAQDIGCPIGLADTWISVGYAHQHLSEFPEAVAGYARALELYREVQFRYPEANTLTRLGDTRFAAGDSETAREVWTEALTILTELGNPEADQVRGKLLRLDPE